MLRMADFSGQGLYGLAEPAIKGDNLDVTAPHPQEHVVMQSTSYIGSESLNTVQKVVFFAVIIGVVVIIVRSRSRGSSEHQRFPV